MRKDNTIRHEYGCILVEGPLSLDLFGILAKGSPDGAVLCPDAARMAQVNFAFGKPEDLKQLREAYADRARHVVRARTQGQGLSEEAIEWLATGQQGLSSLAVFHTTLDVPPLQSNRGNFADHTPSDPSDLNRIVLLLQQVPEIRGELDQMRSLSAEWNALVEHFDELEHMLLEEQGADGEEWRAPLTYARMKEIYAAVGPGSPEPKTSM